MGSNPTLRAKNLGFLKDFLYLWGTKKDKVHMDWEDRWKSWRDQEARKEYGSILAEKLDFKYYDHPEFGSHLRGLIEPLVEYFGAGEIPETVQERVLKEPEIDFILENLQTHDKMELYRGLQRAFGQKIGLDPEDEVSGKDYTFFRIRDPKDVLVQDDPFKPLRPSEKLQNVLDFYGYSFSAVKNGYLQVEPKYTNKVDPTGYFYHVTSRELAPLIQKTGLRISNSKRSVDSTGRTQFLPKYRQFPKRIGAIRLPSKNINYLKSIADKVVLGGSENAVAFQIKNFRGPWYRDSAMRDDTSVFTYHNIPASCLVPIDLGNGIPDEIKEYLKISRILDNQYDPFYRQEDYFRKKGIDI